MPRVLPVAAALILGAAGARPCSIAAQAATATSPQPEAAPAPAAAAPSADAEGRWLASNLPKLATGKVMIEVPARIGGTDIAQSRTRVAHAELKACTLTLDRVYDIEGYEEGLPSTRVRQTIPLGRVDPRSINIQQLPPSGPSSSSLKEQPWRVVLALRDGSIRQDIDREGHRSSSNETTLDLIVSGQNQGVEVAGHLQAAIQACQ